MTLSVPLDAGHLGHGGHDAFAVLPLLGSLLLVLLVATAAYLLWRRGDLPLPRLGRAASPEDQAKAILAERFARGELGSDEFMERSSVLGWTPGVEVARPRRRPRR